jgi:hypothetical protein
MTAEKKEEIKAIEAEKKEEIPRADSFATTKLWDVPGRDFLFKDFQNDPELSCRRCFGTQTMEAGETGSLGCCLLTWVCTKNLFAKRMATKLPRGLMWQRAGFVASAGLTLKGSKIEYRFVGWFMSI